VKPADAVGLGLVTVDELYLVDALPIFGESQRARARSRQCGGPAATAMATLARLGVSTRMVSRVGEDADGDFLCNQLAQFGVDVSGIQRGKGASRVAGVFVDAASGDRGFLSTPEDVAPLDAADIHADQFAGAQILHLDDADAAGLAAARLAREAGQRVVFDGTWQSDLLGEFLPLVEAAIVSDFFARHWMPQAPPEEILRALLAAGADVAVLTRGASGAVAATASQSLIEVPAFAVDVVDTTGAGDAFHGGYIYGMLQNWPLAQTLRFAAAAGALNCRALGGQIGLPDLATVQEFLEKNPTQM
tara:strand:+ start:394 stop:1305 length:912 start_codon:yes stop_codon:yes gene_type:complete